jgi:O-antigen/teichoic acid export membrane protein
MLRKILHSLVSQFVGTFALIALGIVFARVLGPSGRGVVSYAWMILGFAVVFGDGPAAAVMAQYGREKIRRGLVYLASIRALLLVALPVSILLLIAGVVWPAQQPLIAVAFALPTALYAPLVKAMLLAEGRVQTANIIDVVTNVGYAVVASIVVLAHGGVWGALWSWVAVYAIAAVVAARALTLRPARDDATVEGDINVLTRSQLAFAGRSGFVYAAGYLNLRANSFVVAVVLGPAALGIYSIVTSTAELLWRASNAVSWSTFGRIASDDDATVRDLIGTITRKIIVLEVMLGTVAIVVGPMLINAVYGNRFAGAGAPLRIILLGIVAYAVEPILGYFLLVRERKPELILAIQLTSAAVCAAATFALIPVLGLVAAALATTVTYIAVVILKGWLVARTLRVGMADLFMPRPSDVAYLWRTAIGLVLHATRAAKVAGKGVAA